MTFSDKQFRVADNSDEHQSKATFRMVSAAYQPLLADQLKSLATRVHGLNQFDRDRLADIIAAMRRKEAALEKFMHAGCSIV